ncbi:MAG: undecaprenyl-phosphate glucose phosphotransferase [Sulfurimicrobium sp.]|nr:undecaprenyl-phosphate glucose phosphotransferase [Sulfurimicrobium sp.]MDP1704258.1 undecaprenyl-phosphate glucose phosphotransferase [Sulfurimicrobium sp.]MDP2196972.1 undecaprenyl-phosphate glucose phosphotransferase [Sulfurimicrobium sp.]
MKTGGMLKGHASALHLAMYVLDWGLIALAAVVGHYGYLGSWSLPQGYLILTGVSLLFAGMIFPQFSLYKIWRGVSLAEEARSILIAWAAVLFCLFGFTFLTKSGADFSRGWISYWAILGWVFLLGGRIGLRLVLRSIRRWGFNQRQIVMAGDYALSREVAERLLHSPWAGLQVIGVFGDHLVQQESKTRMPLLGSIDDLEAFVNERDIDQVWITLPLKAEDTVKKIMFLLRHSTVDIRWVPDISSFRLINHSVSEIAGMPVLSLSASPMVGVSRLLKALEDRLLSALVLILIAPLMAALAVGVRLSSPGPVFYRQERVGWNGKPFMMLKFRSMPVDVEKNGVRWGGAKNKEATKFGAFLRKTSLDELPQFINVLKGDMSIVGPRPERTMFVEKFKDEIPDYMKKHLVKAGITGWAQINGWRGDTDLSKRIEYDLYYIEHWSLWFDLRIILLTVFRGFVDRNAY